ncbi:MAG: hypothetical protein ACJLS2_06215 [Microcella pacifica]
MTDLSIDQYVHSFMKWYPGREFMARYVDRSDAHGNLAGIELMSAVFSPLLDGQTSDALAKYVLEYPDPQTRRTLVRLLMQQKQNEAPAGNGLPIVTRPVLAADEVNEAEAEAITDAALLLAVTVIKHLDDDLLASVRATLVTEAVHCRAAEVVDAYCQMASNAIARQ